MIVLEVDRESVGVLALWGTVLVNIAANFTCVRDVFGVNKHMKRMESQMTFLLKVILKF